MMTLEEVMNWLRNSQNDNYCLSVDALGILADSIDAHLTSREAKGDEKVDGIIGDLCDMEPDSPNSPDTICVTVDHLRIVLEDHLLPVSTEPKQKVADVDDYEADGFAEWLNAAYSFKGDGSFTRWNMEVAYAAGMERAAQEAASPVDDGLYYLQDTRSYIGNCPVWWAKDGRGYTSRLDEAHRYTPAEAFEQFACRDTDLPWPCAEIDALSRPTVDFQHMRPRKEQVANMRREARKAARS